MKFTLAALALVAALPSQAQAWGTSPEDRVRMVMTAALFVPKHCPGVEVKRILVSGIVEANGYDTSLIATSPVKQPIMDTYAALAKHPPSGCVALWEMFGRNGWAVPGVLRKK